MLDTVPSCNLVQHKGNMMQPRENGKNPNFGPPKFFSWVSPLLVVRQCPKLSSYATLRKTNGANLKNNKKPNFGLDFGPFDPNSGRHFFSFSNILSVTRCYGQLSYKISEKANDSILKTTV